MTPIRAALKWVNRFRKQLGRKPLKHLPKGVPNKMFACPLANALDHGRIAVNGDELLVPVTLLNCFLQGGADPDVLEVRRRKGNEWYATIRAPAGIQDFVTWFDEQEHPHAKALSA